MPIVSGGFVRQRELAEAVRRVEESLQPDVLFIRHHIGPDWTGEPSIFLRVLLSDDAAKPDRLKPVTQKVAEAIAREVAAEKFGLHPYISFRSKAEQDRLQEPAWA